MSIYLFIYGFLFSFGYLSSRLSFSYLKGIFYSSFFLLLFVILGFRSYSVGSDTPVYYSIFSKALSFRTDLNLFFTSRFELGFLKLNKLVYGFSQNFTSLLLVYAFLGLALYFYVILKDSKDAYLSLGLFLSFRIYFMMFSNIRQPIAMGIVLLIFHLLKKDRWLISLVLIGIASSFHLSALVFLPMFFLKNFKFTKKFLTLTVLASIITYASLNSFLSVFFSKLDKYSAYQNSTFFSGDAKISLFLNFIIILLVFIIGEMSMYGKEKDKEYNFLRNTMIFALVWSFISINSAALNRGTLYYSQFLIIYLPYVTNKLSNRRIAEQYTWIIMIAFFVYNIVLMIYRPEFNIIIPYSNVLFI